MQTASLDDLPAQKLPRGDIRGALHPSDIGQRRDSMASSETFCWSSVVTMTPFVPSQHSEAGAQDETVLLEAKQLGYNRRIEIMRQTEYPMLRGITYLDHGGTTLASESLMNSFCTQMKASILSNPHSDASRPSFSAMMVEQTRQKVLRLFSADPNEWDVVFTANATASVKLVMECFAGHGQGFDYLYHRNAHTSLVGVREQAQNSHCLATTEEMEFWLSGGQVLPTQKPPGCRPVLFSYPAQSNMNGERLPLSWPSRIRQHDNTYTLLDAAALVSTSPLDLSDHATSPDFVSMSFYKIFGFPDLGALLVRKASAHVLRRRRYFGGGTTEMIGCIGTPWVERKDSSVHASLEDGTIAIRSVLALSCAIDTHTNLFGGLAQVSKHTGWLAKALYDRLANIKHANGMPVCHMYKAPTSAYDDRTSQGATVTFNVRKSDGSWKSGSEVGAMLRASKIHVRTGSLCNPAGMASALGLSAEDLRAAFDSGFRCNQTSDDIRGDIPFGMIRATLGAMSTLGDVENLVDFFQKHLVDNPPGTPHRSRVSQSGGPESSGLPTISFNERPRKTTGQPTAIRTHESIRPGPQRQGWIALFSCYSRRK
ncbi:pyridoxal phosphate-dependent transferase [Boeremia exigua]|uniref:pyridoxal phosphate-dependent transferase n=1 Tax=Boeremia exigua TaxID=749465 RepID=UPI001E8D82EC|nr:pyridoxal phosphate-dependent transferase [Boeremia exigua]KAH6614014.1 pyridoxal phosphate-dependent transferase [Boeremia exigua]